MASKNKKQKNQVQVLPLNKQNALWFANLVYSDHAGMVQFMKLCDGDLSNGKDGSRTLHCAIGEAYFQFVNRNMRSILNKDTVKDDDGYDTDYRSQYHLNYEGNTAAAIDALVDVAQLKSPRKKQELAEALEKCVSSNDDGEASCDVATFMDRAKEVSDTWKKKVIPLLK